MSVLVDSSAWIGYFRSAKNSNIIDLLIEEDLIVTNNLILAEIIPTLNLRKEKELSRLLFSVRHQEMSIDWGEIIELQTTCLKNGMNGIGIPDLIIAQNAIQGHLMLLSHDKHFKSLAKLTQLELCD